MWVTAILPESVVRWTRVVAVAFTYGVCSRLLNEP
jgi:hypothetical protein